MPYTCPVCGFPNLDEQPRDEATGGSYEICPSCGFQFGVSDDDRGFTYEQWRQQWIEGGMIWDKGRTMPPSGWNPVEQLRHARFLDGNAARSGAHETSLWQEIHGFNSPGQYRRFEQYLEDQVASGLIEELSVDQLYGKGMVYGGRWFRNAKTGATWRLVAPDLPFRGLWEPIVPNE